jgi:hypothetical protein
MDAATLYMIVTLKDGTMRTAHIRHDAIELCERSLAAIKTPRTLAWCTPDRKHWTVVVH